MELYLFSGFRWQDGLDILLNSYILFRFYVLFRGTNVLRALLVIGVLWVISQAAVFLGLIITNWAMQGVIAVAALIIIIIFRNEISSVFQTRDLKSFFWGIPRHKSRTPLNIIVESVHELARKKIGALVVLPLKKGMESVVQGGFPIGAKLSQEMLVSLFWPDNPLHDGAVIIQGDRITRAGAILPLSQREDLPAFFGTRHRAALGITALTDALVIVVSEERGKISIFKKNKNQTVRNRAAFEDLLQDHSGDDSSPNGFRHQTVELITAAVICLFCVTGIWLSFSKGMETLAVQDIPVEFMKPAQKLEITSSSVSSVKLLVSGARPLINSIKPEQIKIKLNLVQSKVGENQLAITRENILLPPGIQLKKIDPSELTVTLDTFAEKNLPIQPHWVGKLPPGLVMESAHPLPGTVRVEGGSLLLKEIATVFTEPIPLDNIKSSGNLSVGLVINPPSLKLKNMEKITINYLISRKIQVE